MEITAQVLAAFAVFFLFLSLLGVTEKKCWRFDLPDTGLDNKRQPTGVAANKAEVRI